MLCISLSSFFLSVGYGQIGEDDIYISAGKNSKLSAKFVDALCDAARKARESDNSFAPSELEALIIMAASTGMDDSLKADKVKRWHARYGRQCQCEASKNFPKGSFLRQVVHSNYRSFANKVGPRNELPLNLSLKGPHDDLTIYEYINQERIRLEAKHHDKRFEFQQDEDWRNIMFFYFLFSEYSIN